MEEYKPKTDEKYLTPEEIEKHIPEIRRDLTSPKAREHFNQIQEENKKFAKDFGKAIVVTNKDLEREFTI